MLAFLSGFLFGVFGWVILLWVIVRDVRKPERRPTPAKPYSQITPPHDVDWTLGTR